MKQREILLFDEALEMLKAFHEADFDLVETDNLFDFFAEHQSTIGDLFSMLSKCFLFDDYYEKYREFNQQLLEDTNA